MRELLQPVWENLFEKTGVFGLFLVTTAPLLLGILVVILLAAIGAMIGGHTKRLRRKAERCNARGEYEKAFGYAQKVAKKGEPEDWYRVGMHYLDGRGVSQTVSEAEIWLRKAADKNYAQAQYQLGKLLFDRNGGKSVDCERLKGLKWLRRATDQGHQKAAAAIAENERTAIELTAQAQELYLNDEAERARETYLDAAQRGHPGAQGTIGSMYVTGSAGEQNRAEGLKWLLLAAESGNDKVYGQIGGLYYGGSAGGVKLSEALKWFLKDAQQDNAESQYRCGYMYLKGEGTSKNVQKSKYWLEKAARQYHVKAIGLLAEMKEEGAF